MVDFDAFALQLYHCRLMVVEGPPPNQKLHLTAAAYVKSGFEVSPAAATAFGGKTTSNPMFPMWNALVRSRAFWLCYISAGVDLAKCPSLYKDQLRLESWPSCGVVLTFLLPDPFMFRLKINVGEHRLELSSSDMDDMLIGTMDCHQMSDVFRWSEFEAVIAGMKENAGPEWAHQLLIGFYVAVTNDCSDQYLDLLKRCLGMSKVFTDAEIEYIVGYTRRVAVRKDFRWVEAPDLGWVAKGKDAYSMRHTRGGFNFDTFRNFLAELGV